MNRGPAWLTGWHVSLVLQATVSMPGRHTGRTRRALRHTYNLEDEFERAPCSPCHAPPKKYISIETRTCTCVFGPFVDAQIHIRHCCHQPLCRHHLRPHFQSVVPTMDSAREQGHMHVHVREHACTYISLRTKWYRTRR